MEFVTSVDNYFMSLFTTFTKWFLQLTGRTNFFLAKIAVYTITMGLMIYVINFWFSVLSISTNAFEVVLTSLFLIACFKAMMLCDYAEKNTFSDERTKVFNNTPILRFLFLIVALISTPAFFIEIFSAKGIVVFKIILSAYPMAFVTFLYFTSIDPPTLGKSKVSEWVEAFTAGFRKLSSALEVPAAKQRGLNYLISPQIVPARIALSVL